MRPPSSARSRNKRLCSSLTRERVTKNPATVQTTRTTSVSIESSRKGLCIWLPVTGLPSAQGWRPPLSAQTPIKMSRITPITCSRWRVGPADQREVKGLPSGGVDGGLGSAWVPIVDDQPANVVFLERLLRRMGVDRTMGITDPRWSTTEPWIRTLSCSTFTCRTLVVWT